MVIDGFQASDKTIRAEIRRRRAARGLSPTFCGRELLRLSGKDPDDGRAVVLERRRWTRWERGDSTIPAAALPYVAAVLGCGVGDILRPAVTVGARAVRRGRGDPLEGGSADHPSPRAITRG